jgi:hypothetical protein
VATQKVRTPEGNVIERTQRINRMAASVLAAASSAVFCAPALAHHSFAMFDQTRQLALTGTLADFNWTNPHIWFDLRVTDDKGGVETWGIEADSPATLTRGGWRYDSVKVGDTLTFAIHPEKNGKPGGSLISVTLPDGKVLGRGRLSGLPEGVSTEGRAPEAAH